MRGFGITWLVSWLGHWLGVMRVLPWQWVFVVGTGLVVGSWAGLVIGCRAGLVIVCRARLVIWCWILVGRNYRVRCPKDRDRSVWLLLVSWRWLITTHGFNYLQLGWCLSRLWLLPTLHFGLLLLYGGSLPSWLTWSFFIDDHCGRHQQTFLTSSFSAILQWIGCGDINCRFVI